MTKDIGIVLLPNQECKDFAIHMASEAAKALPSFKEATNNPHITLIHIANLNPDEETKLHEHFLSIVADIYFKEIHLPIIGINPTGGNDAEGYKWLDLQFETLPALASLREPVIANFCPFHNGTLTRMHDDMEKFTPEQKDQIEKCGVTFGNYLPHITTWYIDLPNESKTTLLQDLANSLKNEEINFTCRAEAIALVELGRNGNAIEIIQQYSFQEVAGSDSEHMEL